MQNTDPNDLNMERARAEREVLSPAEAGSLKCGFYLFDTKQYSEPYFP
jgi:hypothetical protein